MIKKNVSQGQSGLLIIYSRNKGRIELRADTDKETIWASLDQISELFDRVKMVTLTTNLLE